MKKPCKICKKIINSVYSQTRYCKTCKKIIIKKKNVVNVSKRRRKLKELAVAYKGGSCRAKKCGYNRSIAALEFHHLDPNKKDFSLSSSGTTKSWDSIKIELDKCVLLCANCHREIHNNIINLDDLILS